MLIPDYILFAVDDLDKIKESYPAAQLPFAEPPLFEHSLKRNGIIYVSVSFCSKNFFAEEP